MMNASGQESIVAIYADVKVESGNTMFRVGGSDWMHMASMSDEQRDDARMTFQLVSLSAIDDDTWSSIVAELADPVA